MSVDDRASSGHSTSGSRRTTVVPMPAVVFTLCHAVETKPLPFGSIFFVALLVTFVVLGRAACASRPASRLKLRHGKHLRYPGQRPVSGPPRNTTVPGLASWDFSTLRGFFSLLLFGLLHRWHASYPRPWSPHRSPPSPLAQRSPCGGVSAGMWEVRGCGEHVAVGVRRARRGASRSSACDRLSGMTGLVGVGPGPRLAVVATLVEVAAA